MVPEQVKSYVFSNRRINNEKFDIKHSSATQLSPFACWGIFSESPCILAERSKPRSHLAFADNVLRIRDIAYPDFAHNTEGVRKLPDKLPLAQSRNIYVIVTRDSTSVNHVLR